MPEESLLHIFIGKECMACGYPKPRNTAFCRTCYYSLPVYIKDALWQRFGEGFEQAYKAGLDWLKATDAQHQPPPVHHQGEK